MYKYFDESKWNNSLIMHLVVSLILWGPVTAFMVYVAVEINQLSIYFWVFSISLVLALYLFNRVQTNLLLPTIEVSDCHMVVNTPMSKRAVYNLECIEGARFIWHILYFRHNGWPILTSLPRMPKESRDMLVAAIKGSQQS